MNARKSLLKRYLVVFALIIILHGGIFAGIFYFSHVEPVTYILVVVFGISLIVFLVRGIQQYLAEGKFIDTAEKMGIKLNYSLSTVTIFVPQTGNFDGLFGTTPDAVFNFQNKEINIYHRYEPQKGYYRFFKGTAWAQGYKRRMTAFEIDVAGSDLDILITDKTAFGSTKRLVTVNNRNVWFLHDESQISMDILNEKLNSDFGGNFWTVLDGINKPIAILIQNGKLRLMTLGYKYSSEDIEYFCEKLMDLRGK